MTARSCSGATFSKTPSHWHVYVGAITGGVSGASEFRVVSSRDSIPNPGELHGRPSWGPLAISIPFKAGDATSTTRFAPS